tara:strand:- start:164 stop:772 length:609 start_codon:yes stop_codon:yes gene_type:complete
MNLKLKNFFTISVIGIFLVGCATPGVPYTYVNTYTPEALPKIDRSKLGSNSISGSAFLRQGGGGIVNCAGNTVLLKKQVSLNLKRNAYASEYLALPNRDRAVTVTDPALIEFEKDLAGIRGSFIKRSACDVDGKFKFANLDSGTYKITTKVYWVVMDEGQGGIMGTTLTIPENATNQDYSAIVNTITRSCGGLYGGLYCNVR